MTKQAIPRMISILIGALAVALLVTASASAAGKPIVTGGGGATTLTELWSAGSVNPNGASTEYQWEYGKTSALGSSTPAKTLTGTTPVNVETWIPALAPNTQYWFRLSATNQYGTTVGTTYSEWTGRWSDYEGKGLAFPQPVVSKGTFTISVPKFGVTITCVENGSGTIGSPGGEDAITLSLTNCQTAGNPKCNPAPMKLNVRGNLTTDGLDVHFNHNECSLFDMSFSEVIFKPTFGSPKVELSMTLTGQATFGGPVTLTSSSKWSLSGFGTGIKFDWHEH
jgi:hypothetical protein